MFSIHSYYGSESFVEKYKTNKFLSYESLKRLITVLFQI